jgi:transposase
MWVPPEEPDPVLLHAPTRKSVALFGAVHLRTGQLVTQFAPQFNAVTFAAFLHQLWRHRRPDRRLVLVLDNARYHHATLLQPFLTAHRAVLSCAFLPPYSPDLNPIERVWKLARKLCTHNQYFPLLSDLVAAVASQLNRWSRPNPILSRLCGII